MTAKTPYKTPARLAVEQAIRWQVPFTVMDIQQYSDLDERRTRQFLTTLVGRDVLACTDGIYSAASEAEVWLKTPPRSRPGGNDPAYKRRKAVLDRWRQAAWQQGRQVDADTGKTRKVRAAVKLTAYTTDETAVFLGVTPRCIRYKIRDGDIKTILIGKARRIAHNEIVRILEGRSA